LHRPYSILLPAVLHILLKSAQWLHCNRKASLIQCGKKTCSFVVPIVILRPARAVFPYFYHGLPASGPGSQNMNSLGVNEMHSTSKSSLHTWHDNPPIRKDNCIVLLTSISILKRDHPNVGKASSQTPRHPSSFRKSVSTAQGGAP
jgi:hypothetical protein